MARRRRKRPLPRWTHTPIYHAIRTGAGAFHLLGPAGSARLLRAAGGAYAALPINRARLERARDNLRWCFPDLPEPEIEWLSIEAYRHLFRLAGEIALAPRLLTSGSYARLIGFDNVEGPLRETLTDRPALLVTGHCGNWELLGYALGLLGFPVQALYRPLDMAPLDGWVRRTRERRGLRLLDKFGAAAALPELMERRELIGFIADQNAGDKGLFVPFFGRLASAYKTVGVLAMRHRAAVLCGQAVRVRPGPAADRSGEFRYMVDVVDTIRPEDWEGRPDPLFYITARYRRAIETMVRRSPEQYLWMHRYWKSRPRHERRGEPFPPRLRDRLASLPWMDDRAIGRLVERSARDAAALQSKRKRAAPV